MDTILTVFHMQKQDYKMALRKYRKALNYLDVCWDMEDMDQGYLYTLLI